MTRRAVAPGPAVALLAVLITPSLRATDKADTLRPARERFAAETSEVPDFQRHILPLMGRLGCNSRACHGSFQGQGGFRLSLFGYDFQADHEALLQTDTGRVDRDDPEASKIIAKPTLMIPHKGGKRMEVDSWASRMFIRWIEAGAKGVDTDSEDLVRFERLEVSPAEIVFQNPSDTVALKVVAVWSDGSREDVTCLSRFRTNDESVAEIDEDGVVRCLGAGDTHVVVFYDNGVHPVPVMRPVSDKIGPAYPEVPTPTKVDALIVEKLRKLGIIPSGVCTDAEFLRRVRLDLTGTLPSPSEIEAFLADTDPAKRSKKIDELLETPAYAAWWTTVLCDLTGNNAGQILLQGGNAGGPLARQWYEWIERRVRENVGYDQIMAGIALGVSRNPGESYDSYVKEQSSYFHKTDKADFTARDTMPYFWARRNLRKAEEKALAFSYTFLGVKLECAQCHKHPFDQWTQRDFQQFQAFFEPVGVGLAPESRDRYNALRKELELPQNAGQAQRKINELLQEGKVVPWQEVFVNRNAMAARSKGIKDKDARNARSRRVITPKVLGGEEVEFPSDQDPRQPLVDWMRSQENPYLARAFVNRVWANHFGRGIIHPPDDMNLANPPSNEALLDSLANGFVASGFDMKWLHRAILNSHAYQRAWQTNPTNQHDDRNFSHAIVRRLPAEVVIDAITMATADSDKLAKLHTVMESREIGPNGPAQIGRNGRGDYAGRVFGRSTRETNCDCDRSNEPNLLQAVFLQNDQTMLDAILKGGWLAEAIASLKEKEARRQQGEPANPAVNTVEDDRESRRRRRERRAEVSRVPPTLDGSAIPPEAIDAVIRQTFLRTVSRPPTEDDLVTARAYLADVDPSKGLRDLLWALLNTKEFVTNH